MKAITQLTITWFNPPEPGVPSRQVIMYFYSILLHDYVYQPELRPVNSEDEITSFYRDLPRIDR
ncbi:MAG TPA: hypothetical protein VJY31_00470, partial [Buttiauxella sp.]|nr:hypothetical protein [Buttiauxella sp.]